MAVSYFKVLSRLLPSTRANKTRRSQQSLEYCLSNQSAESQATSILPYHEFISRNWFTKRIKRALSGRGIPCRSECKATPSFALGHKRWTLNLSDIIKTLLKCQPDRYKTKNDSCISSHVPYERNWIPRFNTHIWRLTRKVRHASLMRQSLFFCVPISVWGFALYSNLRGIWAH